MPSPRDRQSRAATYVVYAVQGLSFATLLVQVGSLQKQLGLDDGALTLLLLIVPVFAGAGSLGAGAFGARFGSKLLLRIAQPVVALAVVLMGLVPSVALAVPVLLVFGVAVGAVDAGMNMQGVAVERRYGTTVLNGFHSVWSVFSLAGALWAVFAAERISLPVTMALPMIVAVAGSLYAGPKLCTIAEEKVEQTARTTPGPLPWRPIIPLCLAMGFLYVGDAAVSNFATVFMGKALLAQESVAKLAYGVYQGATLVVRLGGDLAVRRFGPATVVRIGGLIATVGFLGVVIAPSQPLAVVAFGLTGLGLAVVAPQSFSAAGKLDPAGTGVAIARVNLFNYVGFIVGAAVVGGLADAAGWHAAFVAPLVLAAAIVALAGGFRPKQAAAPTTA